MIVRKRLSFLLILLTCSISFVTAQYFETGTSPATVRWRQIQTEHFRVIFPADIPLYGRRAADVLEYIYKADSRTLEHQPARIPVVLHNRPSFSNGVVSWAPKRSEWYLTPSAGSYAQSWIDQLALHEFRHVVQTDKLNQGFTKLLYYLLGQQPVGLVAGMLPPWYLEGDAVVAETALSNTGRGRDPAFEMPLRAISLSNKPLPYDVAMFGSYRRHVPNRYEVGFQMAGWARKQYGSNLFARSEDYIARHSFLIFPYPFSMKKLTGFGPPKMYDQAFAELTAGWRAQEEASPYGKYTPVSHKAKLYTSYRSPHYHGDSAVVALKTGIAQLAQIVELDRRGGERVLHTVGFINTELMSCAAGRLAWTEEIPDVRWGNRTWSVVKMMNLATGKVSVLKRRTRFFSPALSPDGRFIAVVETPLDLTSRIVVLNLASGEEVTSIAAPNGGQWQTPAWSLDGHSLLAVLNGSEGKSIVRIDAQSGLPVTIVPPTFDNITAPVDCGDCLLFGAHYNGLSNIYAADYRSHSIRQLSAARFGAFDAEISPNRRHLLMSEYTADGYQIVETAIDESSFRPLDTSGKRSSTLLAATLAAQEGFNLQDSIVPAGQHTDKPFRKWQHLFNIHSWAPLYFKINTSDIASTEFHPGVMLLSQDLLGNMTATAGYAWEKAHVLHADFTFKALYPVIEAGVTYGGHNTVYFPNRKTLTSLNGALRLNLTAYLPLNLTRNRYRTYLEPRIDLAYNTSNYQLSTDAHRSRFSNTDMTYSILFYRYLRMSARDLAPRLGFLVQAALRNSPQNREMFGDIYMVTGRLYLPGFAPHHSLQLNAGWQEQHPKVYYYSTLLNFPRGYVNGLTEQLAIALAEYRFPFLYPDWHLGMPLNVRRLSANLFCNAAENRYRLQSGHHTDSMISYGIDLLADVNIMRMFFPINLGVRTTYVPELRKVSAGLLFSVTFN